MTHLTVTLKKEEGIKKYYWVYLEVLIPLLQPCYWIRLLEKI